MFFYFNKRSEKHPPPLTVIVLSFSFLFVTGAFPPTLISCFPSFLFSSVILRCSLSLSLPSSILYLHASLSHYSYISLLPSPFTFCLSVSSLFVLSSRPHSLHQRTSLSSFPFSSLVLIYFHPSTSHKLPSLTSFPFSLFLNVTSCLQNKHLTDEPTSITPFTQNNFCTKDTYLLLFP